MSCVTPQKRIMEDLLQANPLRRPVSAWRTVTDAFWGYDGRAGLDTISCPARVVHGSVDRVVPLAVAQSTERMLPDSQFHELDRSGHLTLVE